MTFLMAFVTLTLFGNTAYIQFEKIPENQDNAGMIYFIKENEKYFDHWQNDWSYNVNKKTLIKGLNEAFTVFSRQDGENLEINLLLGDISWYLYNLDEEPFYAQAEKFFKKAIELAPNDFRTNWFIANFYASSNEQYKAIDYYVKAQKLLPSNEPAAFWEQYAFATATANMPSNCIYAMDRAKAIVGAPCTFDVKLGQSIRNRIVSMKSDSSYISKDIWSASGENPVSFVSRPLGIKLVIDPTWQINISNYDKNTAMVSIVPPPLKNKAGRDITYTIGLFMKVVTETDDLKSYIDRYLTQLPEKKTFRISDKYPEVVSYEAESKLMYQEMGGVHMHMIGIKRSQPRYAGLLLEEPISVPKNGNGQLNFYRASDSKDRFGGVIFYGIMLDTCEDIYEDAFEVFKNFYENQMIIE